MSHRNICLVMHALKITVFAVDMKAATDLIMILSFEIPWVIMPIN